MNTWIEDTLGWIHAECGSFEGIPIDAPFDRVRVRIRDLNVIMEWQRFLSLSYDFSLEVNHRRVKVEPRLLTHSGNSSLNRLNIIGPSMNFDRQNEVLRVIRS